MSEGSPLLLPEGGALRRRQPVLALALLACCVVLVAAAHQLRQVGTQNTILLGGDDWLGAPLAVPEDVRDQGEQQIGEEVTYWNTHSGQIGTGGGATVGYPFARARRGQMLLMPKQQQLGFLGEGPWTEVPDDAAGTHFGAGLGLGENRDGANDVPVDQEAWSAAAQARYMKRPPCHYVCEGGKECEGHEGLTEGDCDEFFGREMDIDGHGWPDKYPSTYDAWTGNTHGLFKVPRSSQLAAPLSSPQAKMQLLRLSADAANAQMDDMFDSIATKEEVNRYAERGIDISGAADSHRASFNTGGGVEDWA